MPIFTVPVHEANDCHDPQTGRFCSRLSGRSQVRRWERRRQRYPRARALATKLDRQMQRVGGNVGRAVTLRKRMDVVAPAIVHGRANSLWGSVKRVLWNRQPYRGPKR